MVDNRRKFPPALLVTSFILALAWFSAAWRGYSENIMSATIVFLLLSICSLALGIWKIVSNKKIDREK